MAAREITLDDFRKQLESFGRPGLMARMLSLLPGMGELKKKLQPDEMEGGTKQMIGIINSMTPAERRSSKLVNRTRCERIALGAGVAAREVRQLVKQFETMKPIIEAMRDKRTSVLERWICPRRPNDDGGDYSQN